ncbi:MAG: hypothetical protein M3Y55_14260, partial [Pseudomonadota bacterium]|nr:hypothetical protein [Pseudomonadota bacterium]
CTASSHLVHAAPAWAAAASRDAVIAHVSGFDFGDRGSDNYRVWLNGEIVLSTTREPAVAAFFRDHAGLDVPVGDFDIGRHRGEDAARKWAKTALPEDQLESGP